ncbi:MAG: DUF1294 domain-containing protein [Clostridia bacterium]|nr:DUF1294 domain-containing protein [Clostridia bacterium]
MHFFKLLGEQPLYILWLWLAVINLAAFLAMGIDKFKASRQKWRIPERTLFLLAAIGGSIGGICGIYVFRHKTLHKKFTLGFPAILILQTALGILIYFYT